MEAVGIALMIFVIFYGGPALVHYTAHRIKLEREREGLPPETTE